MSDQSGPVESHQRIWTIAERRPRRGVSLALRLYQQAADTPVGWRAWAAYTCGFAHIAWERFRPARGYLDEALALFKQLDHSDGRLRCQRLLLTIDHLSGVGAELQDAWIALAADYESSGEPLGAARTRMDQAAHLNALARPDEALQLISAIQCHIESGGHLSERARLLRIAAIANTSAGRFAQAAALLEQSIKWYQEQQLPIDIAKCLHERGWISLQLEQLGQAQADLATCLKVFKRFDLPLNSALCAKNLGFVASRLGYYDQAIMAIAQARQILLEMGRLDFVAHCELHLGIVAYYSGLLDLALAFYRRAELRYIQQKSATRARLAKRNQAMVLRSQGHLVTALAELASIEEPTRQAGDWLELAEILLEQAKAQRDLGQANTSLAILKHAEKLFAELNNLAAAAECRLERAWLHMTAGEHRRAEQLFHSARPFLADRPAHHWRIDYGLARSAEERGAGFEALSHYQQASMTVATLRQQLANEHASSGLFAQARQLFEDALRCAVALGDPLVVLVLIEQQRAVALQRQIAGSAFGFHDPSQRQAYDQVRARLQPYLEMPALSAGADTVILEYLEHLLQAHHFAYVDHEQPLQSLDLPALRLRLNAAFPAGWTTLVYAICGDQLLLVTIDEHRVALDQTPLDERFHLLMERATAPMYRRLTYLDAMRMHQPSRGPWAELDDLSRYLLPKAVRKSLHPERRLLLVPAGKLHLLPWAALRLDDSWLCERATLQILPSLALWPMLEQRRPTNDKLLMIGCSDFGKRALALPHVPKELKLVADHWRGAHTCWLDEQATLTNLFSHAEQQILQNYSVLHIASHAQLFAGRGLLAHIKLWDGDLLLDDVARIGLDGSLVVLVVCDGGANEVLAGEELLGLSRGLLAAGSRDVIASVWPTYDAPTHELLRIFYGALTQRVDAATALTTAQRALAQRYRLGDAAAEPASPLVWGGFLLLGAGT